MLTHTKHKIKPCCVQEGAGILQQGAKKQRRKALRTAPVVASTYCTRIITPCSGCVQEGAGSAAAGRREAAAQGTKYCTCGGLHMLHAAA